LPLSSGYKRELQKQVPLKVSKFVLDSIFIPEDSTSTANESFENGKNSTCLGQIYFPSSGVLILFSQKEVFVIL